jgi:hypothetical protein
VPPEPLQLLQTETSPFVAVVTEYAHIPPDCKLYPPILELDLMLSPQILVITTNAS